MNKTKLRGIDYVLVEDRIKALEDMTFNFRGGINDYQ